MLQRTDRPAGGPRRCRWHTDAAGGGVAKMRPTGLQCNRCRQSIAARIDGGAPEARHGAVVTGERLLRPLANCSR
jgi:hypothetical protein